MKYSYDEKTLMEIDLVLSFLGKNETRSFDTEDICYSLFNVSDSSSVYKCHRRVVEYFKILSEHSLIKLFKGPAAMITIEGQNVIRHGGFARYIKTIKDQDQENREARNKQHQLTALQLNKIKMELEEEIVRKQSEFYDKSIQKLRKELDIKFVQMQKDIRNQQSEFFKTTTTKNKDQMLYIYVTIGVTLLLLILRLYELFTPA